MYKSIIIPLLIIISLVLVICWDASNLASERRQLEEDLDARGAVTTGVIYQRQAEPRGEMRFYYKFNVAKQGFTGNFKGYSRWKLYENDTIQLRYDPLDHREINT